MYISYYLDGTNCSYMLFSCHVLFVFAKTNAYQQALTFAQEVYIWFKPFVLFMNWLSYYKEDFLFLPPE